MRVAYIMSRFPKLTETFVLYEILALEQRGIAVEVFPLLRERSSLEHPEAARVAARAHYEPFLSPGILAANLRCLARRPRAYLGTLFEVLRGTAGSPNFLAGAVGIFPKTVQFAAEMRRLGVEHVHAHFATHPALAALIVHRLTGIPFSFTAHGSDLHVRRRMLDRKVAAAGFVVAISEYNRGIIVEECGEDVRGKVRIVHCGVDRDVFAPRRNGNGNGRFRILCVASFEEVKGHRVLLEACRLLGERGIAFECDLVGDGPLRHDVESRIARHGLADRVRVLGPRPRDEVVELLGSADVFALPSVPTRTGKREGIPVVLMEAMASELPVVSSRLSGIPELVEDGVTGLLAPPGDAVAVADALAALAADPARRAAMGRAGSDRVRRDFDLRCNAATLAQLFDGEGAGMIEATRVSGVAVRDSSASRGRD